MRLAVTTTHPGNRGRAAIQRRRQPPTMLVNARMPLPAGDLVYPLKAREGELVRLADRARHLRHR
jgi:hypothetical protein